MDAEVSVPNETGGGQSKMEAKRVQMMVSRTRVYRVSISQSLTPRHASPTISRQISTPDPPFKTKHP